MVAIYKSVADFSTEICELYEFVNLRIDTENYDTLFLQRLLREIVCRADITDTTNCNFYVYRGA
jgi:hypothetical protein